jgi:hypothetical protein
MIWVDMNEEPSKKYHLETLAAEATGESTKEAS